MKCYMCLCELEKKLKQENHRKPTADEVTVRLYEANDAITTIAHGFAACAKHFLE